MTSDIRRWQPAVLSVERQTNWWLKKRKAESEYSSNHMKPYENIIINVTCERVTDNLHAGQDLYKQACWPGEHWTQQLHHTHTHTHALSQQGMLNPEALQCHNDANMLTNAAQGSNQIQTAFLYVRGCTESHLREYLIYILAKCRNKRPIWMMLQGVVPVLPSNRKPPTLFPFVITVVPHYHTVRSM